MNGVLLAGSVVKPSSELHHVTAARCASCKQRVRSAMSNLSATHVAPMAVVAGRSRPTELIPAEPCDHV
jgi:hypothetical protein